MTTTTTTTTPPPTTTTWNEFYTGRLQIVRNDKKSQSSLRVDTTPVMRYFLQMYALPFFFKVSPSLHDWGQRTRQCISELESYLNTICNYY